MLLEYPSLRNKRLIWREHWFVKSIHHNFLFITQKKYSIFQSVQLWGKNPWNWCMSNCDSPARLSFSSICLTSFRSKTLMIAQIATSTNWTFLLCFFSQKFVFKQQLKISAACSANTKMQKKAKLYHNRN